VQAACQQCGQKITVDDARAPDKPFAVKCPKCQATVRFPGRGAAATPAAASPAAAPAAAPPGEGAPEESPSNAIAHARRELGRAAAGGPGRKVLVALPERAQAAALTQPLVALGYLAEVLDTPEEGGRMLEDGLFDVVVTNRAASVPGRAETLYQRLMRLGPAARRRIFLVLVGDEYKTGDGLQAWALQADLLVNPRDIAAVEGPMLGAMTERNRLYQAFLDARRAAGVD
jgi:hypothetical protein